MSNDVTETTDVTPEDSTEAPAREQETDWKAESRKWEARAKQNAAAAKRLADLEEASKTAEQKQAEALAEAQRELETYRHRDQVNAWAAEIVDGSGIPADVLRGSTRDELEAHFEQIKKLAAKPQEPTGFLPFKREPQRPSAEHSDFLGALFGAK